MATALQVIRRDVIRELGGLWMGTTTAAGASDGSTAVCSSLGEYVDDALKDKFCLLGATNNRRKIIGNTQSSGTLLVRPPFAAQVPNSQAIEIYDLDPDRIKEEINAQLNSLYPFICHVIEDDVTITIADDTYEYALPATVEGDAFQLLEEPDPNTEPWIPLLDWEYDPAGHNIRFNYSLTAGRHVRVIGIGHLSQLDAYDDETELDETQLQILYARVIRGLADQLSARNTGTASDRFEEVVDKWERRVQGRLLDHMTVWPNQTVKLKGWTP